jgi:hypothetical protein
MFFPYTIHIYIHTAFTQIRIVVAWTSGSWRKLALVVLRTRFAHSVVPRCLGPPGWAPTLFLDVHYAHTMLILCSYYARDTTATLVAASGLENGGPERTAAGMRPIFRLSAMPVGCCTNAAASGIIPKQILATDTHDIAGLRMLQTAVASAPASAPAQSLIDRPHTGLAAFISLRGHTPCLGLRYCICVHMHAYASLRGRAYVCLRMPMYACICKRMRARSACCGGSLCGIAHGYIAHMSAGMQCSFTWLGAGTP